MTAQIGDCESKVSPCPFFEKLAKFFSLLYDSIYVWLTRYDCVYSTMEALPLAIITPKTPFKIWNEVSAGRLARPRLTVNHSKFKLLFGESSFWKGFKKSSTM